MHSPGSAAQAHCVLVLDPPLQVVDSEVGRQVEERRKRAGYGGDSTDGEHIGGWKRNDTNGCASAVGCLFL